LLVGWSLGVLMTLGLLTASGGWYEYRELSTTPGSGSPARRLTGLDSACQVDKAGAINSGGFEVVPGQSDGCYLRRPRVRPWQWSDGIQARLGGLSAMTSALRQIGNAAGAPIFHDVAAGHAVVDERGSIDGVTASSDPETAAS